MSRSSWAAVVFLKVPSSPLTSARLLISLFYLPLTAQHGLSAQKSIVEDREGECLPWPHHPSISESVSSTPPQTRTHTHTHTKKNTRTCTKWMTPLPVVPTPLIPATILINLEVLQGQGRTVCFFLCVSLFKCVSVPGWEQIVSSRGDCSHSDAGINDLALFVRLNLCSLCVLVPTCLLLYWLGKSSRVKTAGPC